MEENASHNSGTAGYCPELTLDDYLSRLQGVVKSGDGYKALCPAHNDHNPSLSIRQGDTGKPILYCHVGCSFESILAAMGFDRPAHKHLKLAHSKKIVATYDYYDEHGQLLYQKVRLEPKSFYIRRPDAHGGWINSKGDAPPALYRLPGLLKGKTEGKTGFFVEGEKDADRLHSNELSATTNIEGASESGKRQKWCQAYSDQLAGFARLIILQDNDPPGKALAEHVARQLAGKVADIRLMALPGLPPKGDVSDWLNAGHTVAELLQLVESTEPYKARADDGPMYSLVEWKGKTPSLVRPSKAAKILARHQSNAIAYDTTARAWLKYTGTHWTELNDDAVFILVANWIDAGAEDFGYGPGYVRGTIDLLRSRLAVERFDVNPSLVPFNNGVFDLETKELHNHDPGFRITWCLPFAYDPNATCEPVIAWLHECVKGDSLQVELLRAYLKAILTGRSDFQRYLELIGPGGGGKGTFTRLAESIVGSRNTHATSFNRLETNRFETAQLYNVRLCVITDSEHYTGEMSVLKAITGQDTLPNERKHQQHGESFRYQGMVLISGNENIGSADLTSGLQRRRITVRFDNPIAADQRRNLEEEFLPLLPGVVTWCLSMDDERMRQLLVETSSYVPTLAKVAIDTLLAINPLAAWAHECLVLDSKAETPIGRLEKSTLSTVDEGSLTAHRTTVEYAHADEWLYPSYYRYCEQAGSKAIATRRFTALLTDLLCHQIKLSSVAYLPKTAGGTLSRFKGVRVRAEDDLSSYGVFPSMDSPAKTSKDQQKTSKRPANGEYRPAKHEKTKCADNQHADSKNTSQDSKTASCNGFAGHFSGSEDKTDSYSKICWSFAGLLPDFAGQQDSTPKPHPQDDGYMDSLMESLQPVTANDLDFSAVPKPTVHKGDIKLDCLNCLRYAKHSQTCNALNMYADPALEPICDGKHFELQEGLS